MVVHVLLGLSGIPVFDRLPLHFSPEISRPYRVNTFIEGGEQAIAGGFDDDAVKDSVPLLEFHQGCRRAAPIDFCISSICWLAALNATMAAILGSMISRVSKTSAGISSPSQ